MNFHCMHANHNQKHLSTSQSWENVSEIVIYDMTYKHQIEIEYQTFPPQ